MAISRDWIKARQMYFNQCIADGQRLAAERQKTVRPAVSGPGEGRLRELKSASGPVFSAGYAINRIIALKMTLRYSRVIYVTGQGFFASRRPLAKLLLSARFLPCHEAETSGNCIIPKHKKIIAYSDVKNSLSLRSWLA
ncbi:hypothetical protein [Pseudomonas cichorii]|uniref:hypothetical protein n=1 Tax=Pseudomonas cichorii TaxID=36746 RepID=UPI000EFEEF43|nr:hypothetical protein [Pseudomonas cichorii]